jgi:hypothetical protein
MSERWKQLERDAANTLGGRRVVEDWTLYRQRPDVLVTVGDKRLVIDCKAFKRHAHHRHLDKVQSLYCGHPGDVPGVVTREPGQRAYIAVPLEFLAELLKK